MAARETVLVVEDQEMVRRFMLNALRKHGYRTWEAVDGASGYQAFLRHRGEIDLVLSDVDMPSPGLHMVQSILQTDATMPVAFVSGTPELSHVDKELRQVPLLRKPFTVQQLLLFVRRCLEGRLRAE